jgi:hypothetical protein
MIERPTMSVEGSAGRCGRAASNDGRVLKITRNTQALDQPPLSATSSPSSRESHCRRMEAEKKRR